MKISISYPPIESPKGVPLLSQNRQFQWFSQPTYIYPIIPAYAATLLKEHGHQVSWDDGIAEELTLPQYMERITREEPDLIIIETKTPVIKAHWKIIDAIKQRMPRTKVVLIGDHVTALPQESFEESKVDYILTGGDYDFLLLNLCHHLSGGEELEPGIWYRENEAIKSSGKFELSHDLNSLPFIDRELTKWWLYSEKNGNYKNLPGTYTMVGRDCWWHKCTFCSWTTLYNKFRARKPESLLDEIGVLIDRYKIRSVFDDTGTFPIGKWLTSFCHGMIDRGYNQKVEIGCNMRFGAVDQEGYNLMKKAGFRYLLFGLESANQETLNRINKGVKVNDAVEGCLMAKRAGLDPHLTIMVGYPWETKEDITATIELAKDLFKQGCADTLQATISTPYPGTPLFRYCQENDLLVTQDWDDYDMRKAVTKTTVTDKDIKEASQQLYRAFFTPRYALRKLLSIRNVNDFRYILRGIRAIFGHLSDFKPGG